MKVKLCLILLGGLFFSCVLKAQELRTEICIDFRLNSHTIDSTYMDNAARLDEIMNVFRQLRHDSTLTVTQVTFSGVSSPEGHSQINRRLAGQRMEALEDYVRSHISLPDSLVIHHDDHYIPWHYLIAEVEASDISNKAEILSILRSPQKYVLYNNSKNTIDSRVPALQQLDGGRTWQTLNRRYFAQMRNACAVVLTVKEEPAPAPQPEPTPVEEPADTIRVPETPAPVAEPKPEPDSEAWMRRLYLKSNTVGVAMLIANIAVEVDLAEHWSVTIPYYYSALNYFTSDVKFRTSCLQPEVRYWFDKDNQGWYTGAHLGLAWYNYAKGGDWRYQDHNRHTPLYGGGISGGYRMPISKNQKWWMEFALGAGVYKLHYDVFHNEHNGQRVDTRKRTFYGIDQVAVSFAYRFDLRKKGGKQ